MRSNDRRHRRPLIPELADDHKHHRAGEDRREGVGVERQRQRLHQHDDAGADDGDRRTLPRPAPEETPWHRPGVGMGAHRRTAPKVMPRSKNLRSSTVKVTMGTRKSVVPAATAGQSCPPSPMMKGMKGGVVCASPEVKSTAKAYSFQEKMRQKIAVAAMPVEA